MVGISAASSVLSPSKTVTFDKLDTNKDGSVSIDELAAAVGSSSTSSTQSAKKVEQLFKAIDKDGDGSITSTEKDAFDAALNDRMQATGFMAQQMSGPGAPSPDDLFTAADKDGDGGVSLAEFTDGDDSSIGSDDAQDLFKLIDADADGSITADETKSFFDAMTGNAKKSDRTPPPPGAQPDDAATTSVSLLTEAAKAYSSTSNLQTDLTSLLSSLTDEAA